MVKKITARKLMKRKTKKKKKKGLKTETTIENTG
jgi:hypothetical protein